MKTTRNNFGRKAITFGIVIFVALALVASGFAAWLISSGATSTGEGNIDVVTVSNADLTINLKDMVDSSDNKVETIYFAPQAGDNSGYITHSATSDNFTENLSFTVSGNIDNGDKVGTLSFAIRVPDAVIYAAGFSKSEGSEDWDTYTPTKAYISLPNYVLDKDGKSLPTVTRGAKVGEGVINTTDKTEAITLEMTGALDASGVTQDGFTYKVEEGKYVFEGTFKFGWGEAVGFGNPGRTLDKMDATSAGDGTFEVESYTLDQAGLILRLINLIVNGKTLDATYTNVAGDQVITSGSIPAHTLDVKALPANVLGDTQEAKIKNLVEALDKIDMANLSGSTYTVYITALPK